jgi:flagella basal body P-ring formation protein FlgA
MKTPQTSEFRHPRPPLPGVKLAAGMLALACLQSLAVATATEPDMQLESLTKVSAAAEDALRAQLHDAAAGVRVRAAELDPRLRLRECAQPLTASLIGGAEPNAHTSVRVSCETPHTRWSVYVPVNVESEITVLVLRQSALRGAHLAVEDVVQESRSVPGFAVGYITDINTLQHHSLSRSLPAGTALTADVLLADLVVRQGQEVTLIAALPGINVRAVGKALEDGREGAHIRAQNLASLKVVEGVVDPQGTIQITP